MSRGLPVVTGALPELPALVYCGEAASSPVITDSVFAGLDETEEVALPALDGDVPGGDERFEYVLTGGLDDDVRSAASGLILKGRDAELLERLLSGNEAAEAEVRELEEELAPLSELYVRRVRGYDALRFDIEMSAAPVSEDDETAGRGSLQAVRSISAAQQAATATFAQLEALESRRAGVNARRSELLNGVLALAGRAGRKTDLAAISATGEVVERKIDGIRAVKSLAHYEPPAGDDEMRSEGAAAPAREDRGFLRRFLGRK